MEGHEQSLWCYYKKWIYSGTRCNVNHHITMKNYLLTIVFLLIPYLCAGQTQWEYRYHNSGDFLWRITGTDSVNGKEYLILSFICTMLDGDEKSNSIWLTLPNEYFEPFLRIREEERRVLALRSDYECADFNYVPHTDFVPMSIDSTEVVLYDFSLNIGERYPFVTDVVVTDTAIITTLDGRERKLLCLSNGRKLIEGIGCINSSGGVGFYQKVDAKYDDQINLTEFYVDGQLVYTPEVLSGLPIVPASPASKSSNLNLLDLSGRRLAAPPAKGMYIENGRKIMK